MLETFKNAGVLEAFEKLNEFDKNEEKQIKIIVKHIDKLSKQHD